MLVVLVILTVVVIVALILMGITVGYLMGFTRGTKQIIRIAEKHLSKLDDHLLDTRSEKLQE